MQKLIAKDLTFGRIRSQIIRLALPILGTSFVQILYSFTDMAWLGRLSNEAVAAVGAVALFAWLGNSIALLNKVGSEITVAHFLGKKDKEEAARYASHNVCLSFIISVILLLLFFFGARLLLSAYVLRGDIELKAVSYMRHIVMGFPFIFMSFAFTGVYNACGHSYRPFLINSMGLIINIILDPICIFLLGKGTDGAALATVVSQILVCCVFIYYIRKKDKLLSNFRFFIPLSWTPCKRIFKIGTPAAALNSLFAFVNMYMGRMASAANGHIGILTLTTGGQLEAISWGTAQGFSTALGTFISQNFAAGKLLRVKKAFRITLLLTSVFGLFSTLLYVFGGKALFALIVPNPIAYVAGAEYLRIQGYTQLFMVLEITVQGFFYGLGRSSIPASVSIVGNCLRIPLAMYIMSVIPGINGLWWAIAVSTILKGLFAYGFYFFTQKRLLAKA